MAGNYDNRRSNGRGQYNNNRGFNKGNNRSNGYGYNKPKSNYANNPYNFISLPEHVFQRYEQPEHLPRHDTYGNSGELTGSIYCTFTADTPVCVSNGAKDDKNDFIKNTDGEYMLPGSSIRGMLRNNMTVLGLGAVRPDEDFDNVMFSYRVVGSSKASLKRPAQQYYASQLFADKYALNPEDRIRVRPAYLKKEGSKYYIYDVERYIRVDKKVVPPNKMEEYKQACRDMKQSRGKVNPAQLARVKFGDRYNPGYAVPNKKVLGDIYYNESARDIPVWYRLKNGRAVKILKKERGQSNPPEQNMKSGILVCPGRMNNQNTLYLFPEFDASSRKIEWNEDYKIAYEMDYKLRENTLGGTDSRDAKEKDRRKKYWKLPVDDKPWPVFCLNDKIIGKSPYLRMTFKHKVGMGVPEQHRKAGNELFIDYPYAVFGFTGDKQSYKSRVSVENFVINNGGSKTDKLGCVLGSPKMTSFADYVMQDGKKIYDYNCDNFQMRGIKQYWLHRQPVECENNTGSSATQLALLPKGTEFTGKISFKNLTADELGLLVWCLKLNDGCYHSIGKGKPLGYGRMSVKIQRIESIIPKNMYCANALLDNSSWMKEHNAQELIEQYKEHIRENMNGLEIDAQRSVRDFMYMHSVLRESKDIRYLELSEYQNREIPLPTVFDERKKLEKKP